MHGYEVESGPAARGAGRGHNFVRGQVDRLQDVTEDLVPDRREETKVAVGNQSNRVVASMARLRLCRSAAIAGPRTRDSRAPQGPRRSVCRRDPFLAVMEDVDVAGVT